MSDSRSQHAHPHAVTSCGADFANTQYMTLRQSVVMAIRVIFFYLLSKKGMCGGGGGGGGRGARMDLGG